jgi:hypothetical protein
MYSSLSVLDQLIEEGLSKEEQEGQQEEQSQQHHRFSASSRKNTTVEYTHDDDNCCMTHALVVCLDPSLNTILYANPYDAYKTKYFWMGKEQDYRHPASSDWLKSYLLTGAHSNRFWLTLSIIFDRACDIYLNAMKIRLIGSDNLYESVMLDCKNLLSKVRNYVPNIPIQPGISVLTECVDETVAYDDPSTSGPFPSSSLQPTMPSMQPLNSSLFTSFSVLSAPQMQHSIVQPFSNPQHTTQQPQWKHNTEFLDEKGNKRLVNVVDSNMNDVMKISLASIMESSKTTPYSFVQIVPPELSYDLRPLGVIRAQLAESKAQCNDHHTTNMMMSTLTEECVGLDGSVSCFKSSSPSSSSSALQQEHSIHFCPFDAYFEVDPVPISTKIPLGFKTNSRFAAFVLTFPELVWTLLPSMSEANYLFVYVVWHMHSIPFPTRHYDSSKPSTDILKLLAELPCRRNNSPFYQYDSWIDTLHGAPRYNLADKSIITNEATSVTSSTQSETTTSLGHYQIHSLHTPTPTPPMIPQARHP